MGSWALALQMKNREVAHVFTPEQDVYNRPGSLEWAVPESQVPLASQTEGNSLPLSCHFPLRWIPLYNVSDILGHMYECPCQGLLVVS